MNCPGCHKELNNNLSVCCTCGTMIGDSVREELSVKVVSAVKKQPLILPPTVPSFAASVTFETMSNHKLKTSSVSPPSLPQREFAVAPPMPPAPNLVEFQPKNAALPEWRLQLQNSVRKRFEAKQSSREKSAIIAAPPIEEIEENQLESEVPPPIQHQNKTVQSALERIENSRRHFIDGNKNVAEIAPETELTIETEPKKEYKFHVAARNPDAPTSRTATKNPAIRPPKPHLVTEETKPREKMEFDTNKLPPLAEVLRGAENFQTDETEIADFEKTNDAEVKKIKINRQSDASEIAEMMTETEETDDFVPFMTRFNAGLFDLIGGSFATLILFAPFMLFGGEWFTLSGFLAFAATCAMVMFIYLTTAVGVFGKTFGMRIFALELIDIENEDYPTFHQAAVSSSVYLLSLATGGVGFLAVPFNEDHRAVHDIVSGTMVVKEL